MSEQLLEIIKANTISEQTTDLNLVSAHITEGIVKNLQDKSKLNTYINFVRHISRQHSKKCINKDNVSVYLKHLPIVSKNQQDEELHLPITDFREEVNQLYLQQHETTKAMHKRKAFINHQTQQSLPNYFDYNIITNEVSTDPFQLNIDDKLKINLDTNKTQRESEVKLINAVINLKKNSKTIINNFLHKLLNYGTLLLNEKKLLKWLLFNNEQNSQMNQNCSKTKIIELFPFLLEEELITVANNHLQGQDYEENKLNIKKVICYDSELTKQAFDICQALFVIANHDFKLLKVLMDCLK